MSARRRPQMSLTFSSIYMMLWFMASFDCLRDGSPHPYFLVQLGVSVGTEHVLNFCSDDEDSALDPSRPSDVISFNPCGIENLYSMTRDRERPHDSSRENILP